MVKENVKEMTEYMRGDLSFLEYGKTAFLAQIAIAVLFKMQNASSAKRCFKRLLEEEYEKKEIEANLMRRFPLDLEKIKREEEACQAK